MKQAKKGFNIISSLYTAAEVRGQVRRSRVIGHPSLSKWSLTANHLQSFWGFLSCWHTVHPLYTHCTPTVHPLYTHCTPPSLVWSFSMFRCTGTAEAPLLHMYSMYVCMCYCSVPGPSSLPLPLSQFVHCFNNLLDNSSNQLVDLECIRLFLTMTASPIFSVNELEWALDLFIKYCQVLLQLHPRALQVLGLCNIELMATSHQ